MNELESDIERRFRRLFPLYEHIDLRIESASSGVYRCRVPLTEKNSNHFKTMHAALQFAAAEVLGGIVFAASDIDPRKFLGVVKRFEIEFKRPASTTVTAEAHFSDPEKEAMLIRLREDGRCDFVMRSVLRNENGETVAEGRGVYAVRPAR